MESEKTKIDKKYIVAIIVVFILFFGCGILIGKVLFEGKETDSKVEEKNTNEQTNNSDEMIFSDDKKKKINDFIKYATYEDYGFMNDLTKLLISGKNGLTKQEKELITYHSVVNYDNMTELTSNTVPEKYKNEERFELIDDFYKIYELPIKLYTDEYKRLFNEEYVIEKEIESVCPHIFMIDKELEKMYLSNQCGGTSGDVISHLIYSNYKYDMDDQYYYVYQYVAIYNSNSKTNLSALIKESTSNVVFGDFSDKDYKKDYDNYKELFEENKEKFDTLVWKFDKNLVFVSTENLG